MANYDNQIGKFILMGIVLLAILEFIVIAQQNNQAVNPVSSDARFNKTLNSLVLQVDTSTGLAQESYDSFNSEQPQTNIISIVMFSIVSVGKSFSVIMFGFFNVVVSLPLVMLGIPATIYNLILTWLIIAIIVAAWLLYKIGG